MPQPALDEFQLEFAALENLRVRFELDERAVGLLRLAGVLFLQFAHLEARLGELAVAMAADVKVFRQRVDRLGPHAVEAHAELKHLVVVLRARVYFGDAVHHLAQGDAAPEIAHGHAVAFNLDLHLLTMAHDVFINGVIHDLLEQHVAAVVRMRAGADAPDIHARAQPDVLQRGQCLDLALVVNWCRFLSHKNCAVGKMKQSGRNFNSKTKFMR